LGAGGLEGPGGPFNLTNVERIVADITEEQTVAGSSDLVLADALAAQRFPARSARHSRRVSILLLAASDALLILIGFAIAYWMRYNVSWPAPINRIVQEVLTVNFVPIANFLPYAVLLMVVLLALFAMKGLYRIPRNAGLLDYAGTIISGATTGIALVVLWTIIQRPLFSRLLYAFAWGAIILLLCVSRGLLVGLRRWRWTRGIGRERVLVIGGTGLGRQVMDSIVAQTFLGYSLVGYLEDRDPPPSERRDGHFRHLGAVQNLEQITRSHPLDQVIIALPFWEHHRLPEIVMVCRAAGLEFRVVPDLFELSFDRVNVSNLSGIPLIGLKDLSLKGGNLVLKRAIDLVLILLAAPVLVPLAAVIALAIKCDSPGPAIFKQQRAGKKGRLFVAYKFRTMVVDAEARKADLAWLNEADGPIFKIRNDPRMTRLGRFLRRSSLDEIPQFWNILRGEMSLVGPRPQLPEEVAKYEEWHYRRLEVKPGLTGFWQVLGRSDTSFDEMVRLDIYYAENWSLGMDLRILLETIPAVLSGKGAY
jgi:exopolysaccharide biosynthesis polyprenyl glycosylphosphotransferase